MGTKEQIRGAGAIIALTCTCLFPSGARADRAYLLDNDAEAAQARIDILRTSKSPFMSTFEIAEDQMSMAQLAALREVARGGGTPRLLLDAAGQKISKPVIEYLIQEGVDVRFFHATTIKGLRRNHVNQLLQRMHDKIVTSENSRLLTGGRNAKEEYFGLKDYSENVLDYDTLVDGQAARDARDYQEAMWNSTSVEKPRRLRLGRDQKALIASRFDFHGAHLHNMGFVNQEKSRDWDKVMEEVGKVDFVFSKPKGIGRVEGAEQYFVEALREAKHSVTIDSQYLLFTRDLMSEVKKATDRGVHVEIITNGTGAKRIQADHITQRLFNLEKPTLAQLGVVVREYQGHGKIHSKAIIVDHHSCLVWSFNLDPRSRFINYETGVRIRSESICTKLKDSVESHMQTAKITIKPGTPVSPNSCFGIMGRILLAPVRGQL